MRNIVKKKLYLGRVELRDYEVANLLKIKESVMITLWNPEIPEHLQTMILTPEELHAGQYVNTQYSKYNKGQTYLLRGYKWKGE